MQHRYQKAFPRIPFSTCVQDLHVVSDWLTTNIFVAMGSSFQRRSKIISNFWRRCYAFFCLLRTWHCNTPPGTHHHSYPCYNDYSRDLTHTSDCCILFIRTHHPLGCSLSLPCLCSPVSASKLSKTRRSSACSSCQFDPICQFVSWLQRYACRLYSSIFTTASSEPYIICMTLTI